jgi:hypothetical protein
MTQTAVRVGPHIDALAAESRDDSAIRADYEREGAWGLLASIDLHGCNPETMMPRKCGSTYMNSASGSV